MTNELVTIPVTRTSVPDLEKMVKLTKTYENDHMVTLYAVSRATGDAVNTVEPRFLATPHGKRESVHFYRAGFVVSNTDVHASNGPIRRRTVYILAWGEADKRWMTWSIGGVKTINQGKGLIDRILETGILPE